MENNKEINAIEFNRKYWGNPIWDIEDLIKEESDE